MADVAKKLTEANAGKKAAEDQLLELRRRVENLDQTVEERGSGQGYDARRAVLQAAAAEQRARAADQRAEEAVAAAAETAKEGEGAQAPIRQTPGTVQGAGKALSRRARRRRSAPCKHGADTPSAEMEQMVGEAIEEAEAATREAREECAKTAPRPDRLAAELDAATRRSAALESDLAGPARSKASALEEMAQVRTETSNVTGGLGSGGGEGRRPNGGRRRRRGCRGQEGAEAAADEVRRARADAKSARDEVESLKARLANEGLEASPNLNLTLKPSTPRTRPTWPRGSGSRASSRG